MEALWTGGSMPAAYLRYRATQLYHVTPDVARTIAVTDVLADHACQVAERKIRSIPGVEA